MIILIEQMWRLKVSMLSNWHKIILLEMSQNEFDPLMCVVKQKAWVGVSQEEWKKEGALNIGFWIVKKTMKEQGAFRKFQVVCKVVRHCSKGKSSDSGVKRFKTLLFNSWVTVIKDITAHFVFIISNTGITCFTGSWEKNKQNNI